MVVSKAAAPYIEIKIGDHIYQTLLDTGSSRSLISQNMAQSLLNLKLFKKISKTNIQCTTASSDPLIIRSEMSFRFKIEGFSWSWKFLVADDLALNCILGADFIMATGLILDLAHSECRFSFNRRVSVPFVGSRGKNHDALEVKCENDDLVDPLGHLPAEQKQQFSSLCEKYKDVLTDKLGLTHLLEYEIRLKDTKVIRSHPYKFAPPKMEALRKKVDELLKQDVIEPSLSAYSSPAFLVPKPGGKHRFVVDYRRLNACIEVESTPLPDLHSAFDWFSEAKYFTIFDLNAAYHQIPLSKESRHLSSFCVPWNLFQYKRVPMGLAVGAQTLTRLLDSVFHDLKFKCIFNYLDDLLVYSEDFESHIAHVEEVLRRLRHAGLTVNPEKVQFCHEQISFLGHLVSNKGISIDPARTQGIRDFPPPKDGKGVARFVGMVNFYRRFIPNAAELCAPLNNLRRKGVKFVWGPEQETAFRRLKEAIMSPPVLRMPDFNKQFVLQTDASSVAVAAVLSQEVDGYRQPVGFASRTLTDCEKKSSIYELECLAVVFGVDKFRRFLEHSEFLLETDNQALSWLLAHPRQLGKIGRWVIKISALKFKVQHVRGTQNIVADTLSRMYSNHVDEGDTEPVNCCLNILLNFPPAFDNILSHQMKDPELGPIVTELQAGGNHPPYFLSKGVLTCRAQRGDRSPKIVLPSDLIPMVFSFYHSSPVGGHLGILKTIAKIRQNFIWKGMDRDIAGRVRACTLCSLSKPAQNAKLGFLSSEVADRPMEKLFIDYVGPFPRSKSGNSFLLVAVDAFSKFVWLMPLRRATAQTTIQVLHNNIFQHFGVPTTIVSDNGSQFTSHLFNRMCFGQGILHITTSPYYPQPSHAERFNRNLKSALIAYHAENQTSWDQNLSWLQLAFNTATHEGHKHVPFQLMFGFKPNNPLSNIWKINDLLPSSTEVDVRRTWAAAKRNLLRSHERVKRRYNVGRKDNPFSIGQLVYCLAHPTSSAVDKRAGKLCYRWTGPHRISRFLSPVTALLTDPTSGERFRKAHISHLKAFKSGQDSENGTSELK